MCGCMTSFGSQDCVKPRIDFCSLAAPAAAAAMGNHRSRSTASKNHGKTEAGHEEWTLLLEVFQVAMSPYQDLISEQELDTAFKIYESFESFFQARDDQEAASQALKELKSLETVKLRIAVTGETGAGKSSFINAIRGVRPEQTGAAEIGVNETTIDPTPYECPHYPNVTFYDLPGIGSVHFQPNTYLKDVNFSTYDFFIIVSSERFRSSDADLALEIQKMDKKFYFVRAKVDQDLENEKRARGEAYNEGDVLQKIRDTCRRHLEALGVSSPKVFLLSNWDIAKLDFHQLEDTLEQDLPHLQKLVFLLSLPNFSKEILEKKRAALKKLTWLIALASGGAGAISIPSVSLQCNIQLLLVSMIGFYKHFGLDDESLSRMASQADLPLFELKGMMRSPEIQNIQLPLVQLSWAKKSYCVLGMVKGKLSQALISAACSFVVSVYQLSKVVDELYADALQVRAKALGDENY
ncbi:interferon-inducible GTPase 1-like [Alligator sinensis]|uniref:Interferon-inducible GTPase 1-like n=1 Tax=Alligator sinensis TaxID=38654 RepID=A0A1U7SMN3_ALLSI|nr:interferon-inducible GTPase 1-like [Alligator sinensis]